MTVSGGVVAAFLSVALTALVATIGYVLSKGSGMATEIARASEHLDAMDRRLGNLESQQLDRRVTVVEESIWPRERRPERRT